MMKCLSVQPIRPLQRYIVIQSLFLPSCALLLIKQKSGRVTGKMAIKAFDEKLRVNRIVNKALAISTALIISLEHKRYYRLRCRRRY